jgi:hypothetical protein
MTILGKHTLEETNNLITDNEWRIQAINDAVHSVPSSKWGEVDPTLPANWDSLLERWTTAKFKAKTNMALISASKPGAPWAVVPAEDVFQAILHATSTTYPLYTVTDVPGLQNRVAKVTTIKFGARPKPTSWDFDLSAYKSADVLAKTSQQAGTAVSKGIVDTVKANPGTTLLIGGVVVGGLIAARKLRIL